MASPVHHAVVVRWEPHLQECGECLETWPCPVARLETENAALRTELAELRETARGLARCVDSLIGCSAPGAAPGYMVVNTPKFKALVRAFADPAVRALLTETQTQRERKGAV